MNPNIDRVEGVCELVIGDAQARWFDVCTVELCESVDKRRVASFADVLDERADRGSANLPSPRPRGFPGRTPGP
jgi:hypothetical protein